MNTWLAIGLGFGALAGSAHAYALLRARRERPQAFDEPHRSMSMLMWTVGLWVIFGTYVLSLWVLATIVYAGTRACRLIRSLA